ncbi:MAG TPA: glycosyltransferase [Gemmatimonadales bacterium]|nr:glycosyltransferase [Gemmatimonadales bacterium]
MRLAVFTSKYPAKIATFFERDMRALIETGVEIDVFAISPLDAAAWKHSLDLLGPQYLPRNRIHHLELGQALKLARPVLRRRLNIAGRDAATILRAAAPYGPMRVAKTAYALPKAWAWAAQYTHRFDHVLGYWGNYAATVAYAFHRLAAPQVPFSIWLHAGTDLYRAPVFMREKLAYADNVLTCCEFNQTYIFDQFGDVPGIRNKLHICHHGLNLAEFPHVLDGRAPNRLLAVGSLSKRKGFDYLIRAAGLLVARGVDAIVEIIGDGEERDNLEALAQELGIRDRVEFRGYVPFAAVREAMNRATLLVHPSDGLGDGLPNVVREGMALGAPVVASEVAGIPDALRDGCGVLVPPKNEAALADALELLLRNPEMRREIAVRARRRTEEKYDLWQNGARLARLLENTRRPTTPTNTEPETVAVGHESPAC